MKKVIPEQEKQEVVHPQDFDYTKIYIMRDDCAEFWLLKTEPPNHSLCSFVKFMAHKNSGVGYTIMCPIDLLNKALDEGNEVFELDDITEIKELL